MQFKSVSKLMVPLLQHGWRWQYISINGDEAKPRYYFSGFQILAIVIAIGSNLWLQTGLSKDFTGYVMSAFSISVSLFMSLLVSIFDKFDKTSFETKNLPQEKIARLIQKKNFFKKFISITSYLVVTSIFIIILCSFTYIVPGSAHKVSVGQIAESVHRIDWILTAKNLVCIVYRSTLFYFLINYLLLTFFVAASSFEYYISELNNVKIQQQ